MDKDLPISNLRAEQEYVDRARAQTRFVTSLAGALAAIAVLLASVGIYGVTSYSVVQRSSEIAIRLALGADAADIRRLVLRESLLPVLVGVVTGLVLATALTPLLSGLLYGVSPSDPPTFASISVFVCVVGAWACYIPARRATRVDPMVALRCE